MTISSLDSLRATVQYTLGTGNIHQNVFHFDAGAGVSESEANCVAAIAVWANTAYAVIENELAQDVEPDSLTVAKWNSITGKWEQIGSGPLTAPDGGGSTEMFPHGVSAVIRFLADAIGQQGRKFIGGLGEDMMADGVLVGTSITQLAAWADLIVTAVAVSGGELNPGWWTLLDDTVIRYSGDYILNLIAGYQRRRKPGIGI